MRRAFLLLVLLSAAAGAAAQQYKWVDRNGRVQYGDVPPPGAKATRLRAPSGPASAAPSEPAGKGPASYAEREAEFRKRRDEAAKQAEKQAKADEEARQRKENCALAQASARTLEAGGRIARTDAQGERHFLDDAEIAREAERARQQVKEWCG